MTIRSGAHPCIRFPTFAVCVCMLSAAAIPAAEPDRAPATFRVRFETSAGDFVMEVTRKWAPVGADHFYRLVRQGFYDECRFFRVVPNFVVQFGINGDPRIQEQIGRTTIPDDPVVASNMRGFVTYAKTNAPDSRTTQLFINLADNARLDEMGFAPFGRIVEGMDVVDRITSKYGQSPNQGLIQAHDLETARISM